MASLNEIDGASTPAVTAPVYTNPRAGADIFSASVNNATHETAHLNRLVAADPFASFHEKPYAE